MNIKYAAISECGKRRNNEDSFKVLNFPTENRWVGIVCDGLGGHSMGEVASESVVESISKYYEQHRGEESTHMIEAACKVASADLNAKADKLCHAEMGTTFVMAIIEGNKITIAHIGDSRCYVVKNNGDLIYKTIDHIRMSFGWELVDKCFMSYNENAAKPEIIEFKIEPGDRILICSDGLYKSIIPEILTARMADNKSPEEILDTFAFLCEKNSDDNYTGIFAIVDN